ncbi:hypothetical protein [Burkholderia ambifaria]|uniref:Uncharacterized protein n=1 Tax=Burkholderia ambifaria MEX-5 TaxID=396597 RepID=B1T6U0_9BURK|nr:hypothetical protein [Burkholderia ambifaria]EDT40733.1 hypothetical protein BamMEX5DRAFT_3506 [Burkholderia ambifaria MEX-5]
MNIFEKLMAGEPSRFETALSRRSGSGGLDAVIRRLKEAESAAAEQSTHYENPQERASMQRYVDAISCARVELERLREAV